MSINIYKLKTVYFTPFPSLLYKSGTNAGNMCIAGIGLGLIRCKQFFWLGNLSLFSSCAVLYTKHINNNYITLFLFIGSTAFYIYLIARTFDLIGYLKF